VAPFPKAPSPGPFKTHMYALSQDPACTRDAILDVVPLLSLRRLLECFFFSDNLPFFSSFFTLTSRFPCFSILYHCHMVARLPPDVPLLCSDLYSAFFFRILLAFERSNDLTQFRGLSREERSPPFHLIVLFFGRFYSQVFFPSEEILLFSEPEAVLPFLFCFYFFFRFLPC